MTGVTLEPTSMAGQRANAPGPAPESEVPMQRKPKAHEGIDVRHSKRCRSRGGGGCDCAPTFQAHVWSNRERKRIRKTFPTLSGAKAWRREAQVALEAGSLRAPTAQTLREAAEAFLRAPTTDRSGTARATATSPQPSAATARRSTCGYSPRSAAAGSPSCVAQTCRR
jgi:hypothetical protein